jgi:hypothetical protein
VKTLRKRRLGRLQRFRESNIMIDLRVRSCEDRPTTSMVMFKRSLFFNANKLCQYLVEAILHMYGTLA